MYKALYVIAKLAYRTLLRGLVAEKVADSASKIDDVILSLFDKLFDYDGED